MDLFGFPAIATIMSNKNFMDVRCQIYLTFGHCGVQDALDISNNQPLNIKQVQVS
jgi:hypothetical protein